MGDIFEPTGGGTTSESILTGGQETLLDRLTEALIGQFQGGQIQGVTPFQGLRPGEVPFGPLQQQGFGLAGGLSPIIGQGFDLFGQALNQFDPAQGQGFLNRAGQALETGFGGFDPDRILEALEPGRQLALRTFEQDIVPSILENLGATSGQSGALNKAISEAGANLSLGLGAQAFPFLGQAALQAPGQQFQGAQLAGQFAGIPGQLAGQGLQLGGQGANLLGQLFNIGGLQQQLPIGQAGAEQARFQEAQGFANPLLAAFLGPALGTPARTAFQQQIGPSQFSQVSSLFGGGGAFGTEGAFGPFI